jgi:hypothetical protein
MPVISCDLPSAVHLVLKGGVLLKGRESHPEVVPRDHEAIQACLEQLTAFGIAVLLEPEQRRATFCTSTFVLQANLARHRSDTYIVQYIGPLSIYHHRQLSQRAISVKAAQWQLHISLRTIPEELEDDDPAPSYDALLQAWEAAVPVKKEAAPLETSPTPNQLAYLERIAGLIDRTEDFALRQAREARLVFYDAAEPVAADRASGEEYAFKIATSTPFRKGDYVLVQSAEPETEGHKYPGSVIDITSGSVRIKFRSQIHFDHLPQYGTLQKTTSPRTYQIQRAAVWALRDAQAKNPQLLSIVADHQFAAYQAPDVPSDNQFNAAQRTFIARAEQVPDLLLVLGPPGTGKTHTIREIIRRAAQEQQRVLVTSQSNKALDNVLEGLLDERDLRVLRIGRPEKISPGIQQLLIDEQARSIQADVLAQTASTHAVLSTLVHDWPRWDLRLSDALLLASAWRRAERSEQQSIAQLHDWQRTCHQKAQGTLDPALHQVEVRYAAISRVARQAARWVSLIDAFEQLRRWPLLGGLGALLGGWAHRRWSAAAATYRRAVASYGQDAASYLRLRAAYRRQITASDAAVQLKATRAKAEHVRHDVERTAIEALNTLSATFETGLGAAFARPPTVTSEAIKRYVEAAAQARALADARLRLIEDWRTLLETRHQSLYGSLIREARVIGATCIGIGSDIRFDDLDFDLVIADEAGQIQAADLLVPLARAKRAILVGDHKQLPPLVELDLAKQLDSEPELLTLLQQSLFEQLFETAPPSHKVLLDTQYRMPQIIAEFVRRHFYGGRYYTGRMVKAIDPIFTKPIALIDTSRSPRHGEQHQRYRDDPHGQGYINELESRIITDLFLDYHTKLADLGVIVPYNAQAEHIRTAILNRDRSFINSELIELISTVDSFQGRERDVIIFGFTRSNRRRIIGFMRELRRLNVSITRAKRQLVLIGDIEMLSNSDDPAFAELVGELATYVRQHGEYLTYDEFVKKRQQGWAAL